MPGGFVCSGSMKGAAGDRTSARRVVGERPCEALLEGAARVLRRARPRGDGARRPVVLGPIFVLKLSSRRRGSTRRLVAEMWLYPDGSRILELSTKCAPGEAFQVAAEARAFLAGKGVDLGGEQQTKTRKALEFFS